ncbi:hypothetical protein BJ875DRAFT_443229 [Amylocarpus encephaloides]|uniref:Dienelactone hydrolase domain-containing protein n=1 Tax=Amylocarpus encephaloides TaxID=45428 RepID=A0A9P8C3B0_9HELO|nr:hypothetical protein BJ875DRAFT_443229 [Amylocarpus encephaloides]
MSGTEACCSRPAAKADHKEAGEWIEIEGLKTYHVGSKSAPKAILVLYDIFGFVPQTLQGADILAEVGSGKSDIQVFMPGYLETHPPKMQWFMPNASDQDKEEKTEYFTGIANPASAIELTPKLVASIYEKYPSIKSWGALGLCWGSKVVFATTGQGTPFNAGAGVHPSFLSAKDAAQVTVPLMFLPSGEEDKNEVNDFVAALKVEKHIETFESQLHGWMGSRAQLENEEIKKEYERGYGLVTEWMKKYL